MTTLRERDVAHQLEPGEDHPVLPEPDDVPGGRVQVARVERAQDSRVVRPAERRERPQRRREPRVEDVLAARQLARAALRAGLGLAPPRTVTWPSGHSQSGSWCPHQICREMFQSGASSSEAIAKRCCDSGWKRTRPERSASSAGLFSSAIEHHHCGEIRGSIRVLQRSQSETV